MDPYQIAWGVYPPMQSASIGQARLDAGVGIGMPDPDAQKAYEARERDRALLQLRLLAADHAAKFSGNNGMAFTEVANEVLAFLNEGLPAETE